MEVLISSGFSISRKVFNKNLLYFPYSLLDSLRRYTRKLNCESLTTSGCWIEFRVDVEVWIRKKHVSLHFSFICKYRMQKQAQCTTLSLIIYLSLARGGSFDWDIINQQDAYGKLWWDVTPKMLWGFILWLCFVRFKDAWYAFPNHMADASLATSCERECKFLGQRIKFTN